MEHRASHPARNPVDIRILDHDTWGDHNEDLDDQAEHFHKFLGMDSGRVRSVDFYRIEGRLKRMVRYKLKKENGLTT